MKTITFTLLFFLNSFIVTILSAEKVYDFMTPSQEDIDSLVLNYNWSVPNNDELNVDVITKAGGFLKIGGMADQVPEVIIPLTDGFPTEKNSDYFSSGSLEIVMGTSSSYSGGKLEVLNEKDEVLFHIETPQMTKIFAKGSNSKSFSDKKFKGLNIGVFGNRTNLYNAVTITAKWNQGEATVSLVQPNADNDYNLNAIDMDLGKMLKPGTPTKLRITTSKHDDFSRYIAIFSIKIQN